MVVSRFIAQFRSVNCYFYPPNPLCLKLTLGIVLPQVLLGE